MTHFVNPSTWDFKTGGLPLVLGKNLRIHSDFQGSLGYMVTFGKKSVLHNKIVSKRKTNWYKEYFFLKSSKTVIQCSELISFE